MIETLSTHRVVILEEDQYRVMCQLVDFHDGNDDFGNDPNDWPYDRDALTTLVERLKNQAKAHGYTS